MDEMLDEWPCENLCSAHNGVLLGGANGRMRAALDQSRPLLSRLAQDNEAKGKVGLTCSDTADTSPSGVEATVAAELKQESAFKGAWSSCASSDDCECG